MKRTLAAVVALLLVQSAGCGYFNSLYNAQRRFSDAERQQRNGNLAAAYAAYDDAIARAAFSLEKYPTSRWADDALLLVARARFARSEFPESAAALTRLLNETGDDGIRTEALAYLGASRVRIPSPDALPPLDSAVARTEPGSQLGTFARIWRARAYIAAGDVEAAWRDIDAVRDADNDFAFEAKLEALALALATRDSVRWRAAAAPLMSTRANARSADSIRALLTYSVRAWGPEFVVREIPEDAGAALPEQQRLSLRLLRATVAAAAGDTATALDAALRVAGESSTETSATARVHAARWVLATATDPAALQRARAILLPAFSNQDALVLIRHIRTLDVLISRSSSEPLALFVAAEHARDVLRAPHIARQLFMRFAALPTPTPWRGKALLAAMDLATTGDARDSVQAQIDAVSEDVYIDATRAAADSAAFSAAESKISAEARVLRAEAVALAAAGDVSVARAVGIRDSIRIALARDSVTKRCAFVIDSTVSRGIRADSMRAACMRADTARMNAVLRMDTTKLRPPRDTLRVRPDTQFVR